MVGRCWWMISDEVGGRKSRFGWEKEGEKVERGKEGKINIRGAGPEGTAACDSVGIKLALAGSMVLQRKTTSKSGEIKCRKSDAENWSGRWFKFAVRCVLLFPADHQSRARSQGPN